MLHVSWGDDFLLGVSCGILDNKATRFFSEKNLHSALQPQTQIDLTSASAFASDLAPFQPGNPLPALCPRTVSFSFSAQGFITSALVKWLGALDWYFNWDIINEMCMSGSLSSELSTVRRLLGLSIGGKSSTKRSGVETYCSCRGAATIQPRQQFHDYFFFSIFKHEKTHAHCIYTELVDAFCNAVYIGTYKKTLCRHSQAEQEENTSSEFLCRPHSVIVWMEMIKTPCILYWQRIHWGSITKIKWQIQIQRQLSHCYDEISVIKLLNWNKKTKLSYQGAWHLPKYN